MTTPFVLSTATKLMIRKIATSTSIRHHVIENFYQISIEREDIKEFILKFDRIVKYIPDLTYAPMHQGIRNQRPWLRPKI